MILVKRYRVRQLLAHSVLLSRLLDFFPRLFYRFALNSGSDIRTDGEGWLLENFPREIKYAIDVGLNHGAWSIELLRHHPKAAITGFEVVPEFVEYCRANLPSEVQVVHAALSQIEGQRITLFKKGGGANADPSVPAQKTGKDWRPIVVESTTLDVFLSSAGRPGPDFIKIDTDGFDFFVLAGAEKTLFESRPVVQLEVSRFWLNTSASLTQFLLLLERTSYEPFVLQKEGLMELHSMQRVRLDWINSNIILWPKEKKELISRV